MTGTTYDATIDWDSYWTEADEDDREDASPSATYVVDPLLEFLEGRGDCDSLADVGCGTGTVAFATAERYPDATVVGSDAAKPVLAENRERTGDRGLPNLRFERTVLPEFDPDRQFDVVCCCFTLCYVPAAEDALRALYDAVEPGGDLVVTYHNRLGRQHMQAVAENPEEHLEESSPWEPDRVADRFRALLAGESLLSRERIHDALGAWPLELWSAVDAEPYPAWQHIPLVYVPKEAI